MEAVAKLRNCPMSPRKMRLVVDLIRGKNVNDALNILKFTKRKHQFGLRSCCFLPLITGSRNMEKAVRKQQNFMLKQHLWMGAWLSNDFNLHLTDVHIEFANAETMLHLLLQGVRLLIHNQKIKI